MNFNNKQFDKFLGLFAILILFLFAFRIALFMTYQEAEKGTFQHWMYDALGIDPEYGEERPALPPQQLVWSFEGLTGRYDMASVRRGLQVYREACAFCHSLDKIAFRNLTGIGYSEDEAKAIAAEYTIVDGPDEYGDMFERPGRLADYFPDPFANKNQAKANNNGKAPPDLSLMAKARQDGPNYIYSILTGYQDIPDGLKLNSKVTQYNPYFPYWEILMPPPLYEVRVEYPDGTEASVDQMGKDVANFLMWTAEPNLEDRHEMGFKVIVYMIIFTLLLFISMRVIWRRVKN